MARALVATLSAAVLGAAACGGEAATPLAVGCTNRDAITRALEPAPQRPAVLRDGTLLSRCIADGQDDAELQSVGLAYSGVAEAIRVRARERGDVREAQRLGFLIGATRRGAARTEGVMAELVRRVELVGGRLSGEAPRLRAAVDAGLAAGEARG